jgi:cytidylate kinase|tara:strand:- start:1179 stop:1847 length:669 start_codon:yes stop_codon:yes gene_type:complete
LKKRKDIITVAIDSPAAAGAGTQAKLISKYYNLLHLDTGRIYRLIGKVRLKNPNRFSYLLAKKKIKNLKISDLNKKSLLTDKVAVSASIVARDKKIRDLVHKFQQKCAYNPPKKYSGSVLDGRDIITVQVKDAMFKFFITASLNVRAKRRHKEYKNLNKKITFKEVLKSLKNRDKSDRERKYGPLKKTKDSVLLNTTKLSRRRCFLKIKTIMDRKLKINGYL